jgi:hypothetical protein
MWPVKRDWILPICAEKAKISMVFEQVVTSKEKLLVCGKQLNIKVQGADDKLGQFLNQGI